MDPRRTALSLAAGLIILAGAAVAQPLNISNSPGVPSGEPQVAADSLGNVHAVWVEFTGFGQTGHPCGDVYYVMGDLGALQLGTPVKISTSGAVFSDNQESVSIAVDGSNRVYVIWVESRKVMLRIKDGGVWGDPIVIDSGQFYDAPRIAVSAGGDIYLDLPEQRMPCHCPMPHRRCLGGTPVRRPLVRPCRNSRTSIWAPAVSPPSSCPSPAAKITITSLIPNGGRLSIPPGRIGRMSISKRAHQMHPAIRLDAAE